MKFSIGSFDITILRVDRRNPFNLGTRARRKLAKRIDRDAVAILGDGTYTIRIARIKAMRIYAMNTGIFVTHNFGLKSSKEWVGLAFADNGNGEIA